MIRQIEQQEIEQNNNKKQQNESLAIIDPQLEYNYKDLYPQNQLSSLFEGHVINTSITENDILYKCYSGTSITNQFLLMVHYAYYNHFPLRFSPDDIQLLINQGLCAHINNNSEHFRKKFVQHEGQKPLDVFIESEDIFSYDWKGIISNFSNQINQNIGNEKYKLFVHKYSTTDQIATTCYEVSLMDSMKNYFKYIMYVGCGISKIKLLGTLEDWQSLRKNVEILKEFQLDNWLDRILPILDQFINLYQGNIDSAFWKDIYRFQEGGLYNPTPSYATGWITNFFLYKINENSLSEDQNNKFVRNNFSKLLSKQPKLGEKQIPSGISQAPVQLINLKTKAKKYLKFNAGFLGVAKDQDGFIYAKQGWAIVDDQQHNDILEY